VRAHPRSVAVIGIGNALRGDDAAGLEIARRLRRSELPAGVSVHEHEGEGMTLLELWDAADVALVVDTVRSGTSPGTIHRIDVSSTPVPSSLQRTSSHTIGVAEAIELARTLGKLPSRVIVYGIVGARRPLPRRQRAALEGTTRSLASRSR
jgi:hydrogenase maturation protease